MLRAARTNPHQAHTHSTTRDRIIKGTDDVTLVTNPVKTDYPETTLEHEALTDVSEMGAAIEGKATNNRLWRYTQSMMSARSKRHLRQLIETSGVVPVSNIQVNDQGKYLVYVNDTGPAAVDLQGECLVQKGQKIEDLPLGEVDC